MHLILIWINITGDERHFYWKERLTFEGGNLKKMPPNNGTHKYKSVEIYCKYQVDKNDTVPLCPKPKLLIVE